VAAIFKAPLTGLVFALEVPYQEDLARRMLLPAAISSASSYVIFAAIAGTAPILPIAGQPPFNLVDLGGAAVVGLACGLLARLFILIIHTAKGLSARGHPAVRAIVAGGVLAGTVLLARLLGDEPLAIGPGYNALRWALDPQHSVLAIIALGTLRVVGTGAAISGGGAGGLFIPLVIQGALVGRAVGGVFDAHSTTLFPVVGMAAFLGAGYRVPLAAVVFVAEFTGRPGFVVPGLIAAVIAQLVMGRASLSPYQAPGRAGHLEDRLRLPISTVVNTGAVTVTPDTTVHDVFWTHLVAARQHSVAVVDATAYLGIAHAADMDRLDRAAWPTTPVSHIMRTDLPAADTTWALTDAIRAMKRAGTDRIAVCHDNVFIGVVTTADLLHLDDVVDQASPDE
jgi:CBS domain-containing protein